MFTAAVAVPAKRGQWKTVTLADGTKVRVELRGDEFCHYWQAEDGRTFIKDTRKGYYKAADVAAMMSRAKAMQAKVKAATEARRAQARTGARQQAESRPYFGDKRGLSSSWSLPTYSSPTARQSFTGKYSTARTTKTHSSAL